MVFFGLYKGKDIMKKNTLLILLALPILFLGGCNRDDGDTIINKDGDTIINNTVAKSLPLNTKVSFGQHSAPNYQCTHLISPNNNFIGYVSQQGSRQAGRINSTRPRPVPLKIRPVI
jgi:hypothetical protein